MSRVIDRRTAPWLGRPATDEEIATLPNGVGVMLMVKDQPNSTWVSARLSGPKEFHKYLQNPGGSLEPNEGVLDGVLRELKEETGISVTSEDEFFLLGSILLRYQDGSPYVYTMFELRTNKIPQRLEPVKMGTWLLYSSEEIWLMRRRVMPSLLYFLW